MTDLVLKWLFRSKQSCHRTHRRGWMKRLNPTQGGRFISHFSDASAILFSGRKSAGFCTFLFLCSCQPGMGRLRRFRRGGRVGSMRLQAAERHSPLRPGRRCGRRPLPRRTSVWERCDKRAAIAVPSLTGGLKGFGKRLAEAVFVSSLPPSLPSSTGLGTRSSAAHR